MSSKREVTELDLRMPEFQRPDIDLDDLEFDSTGSIVRKDRWESIVRRCAMKMGACGRNAEYEVDHVYRMMEWMLDQIPSCPDYIEQAAIIAKRDEEEEALRREEQRQACRERMNAQPEYDDEDDD